MHGNRRATCHIDNRRSFCIREGKGCRGVAHVGHAISAAGHCLLLVAHVQLERNLRECPCNELYFLACIPHAGDAGRHVEHARMRVLCVSCERRVSSIALIIIFTWPSTTRESLLRTYILYLSSRSSKVLTFLIRRVKSREEKHVSSN